MAFSDGHGYIDSVVDADQGYFMVVFHKRRVDKRLLNILKFKKNRKGIITLAAAKVTYPCLFLYPKPFLTLISFDFTQILRLYETSVNPR